MSDPTTRDAADSSAAFSATAATPEVDGGRGEKGDSSECRASGRVLAREICHENGRPVVELQLIEDGARRAIVGLDCGASYPATKRAEAAASEACSGEVDHSRSNNGRRWFSVWFDSLSEAQSYVADDFQRSLSPYYHFVGWRRFKESVLALGSECTASSRDGLTLQGDQAAALLRGAETLVEFERRSRAAFIGERVRAVRCDGRFALVVVERFLLEQDASCESVEGDEVDVQPCPQIRWFETAHEMSSQLEHDHREESMTHRSFYRTFLGRLARRRLNGLVKTVAGAGGEVGHHPETERARRLFPDAMSLDPDGAPYWVAPWDWGELLQSFGEALVRVDDELYSGDSRVLLKSRGRFGFLIFGWGSCSFCDALQLCGNYRELEGLIRYVESGIRWFDTLDDVKAYVGNDAERRFSHFFHSDKWSEFRSAVLAFVERP